MIYRLRASAKIVDSIAHKVFFYLNTSAHKKLIVYKNNLYSFSILGETGKYTMLSGLVLKTSTLRLQYCRQKRLQVRSFLSNEYVYLLIPLELPSLGIG